jgi:endo-1,4-beta-mannosidase
LAYFGTPQWQWTKEDWLETYAAEAAAMGMKWVRFFAAHNAYTEDQIVKRVGKVLEVLAKHKLIAVICFADSLSEKGMFPKGDEQWHTGSRGHYIKDYFNNGNYRQNYLPFVKRIVSEFKGHQAVGMWQLMNELAIYNPPANDNDVKGFAGFVDEVSAAIYQLDQTHPISIGIINTAHIMPPGKDVKAFATEFYSKRKYIHAATSHCYQFMHDVNPQLGWEHEDYCALDAEMANASGRAVLWTEFGAANNGDRRASSERFLSRHFIQGPASAALQWGFMLNLGGISDSGIGDGNYGFSPGINAQYDKLKDLFVNLAKQA